MYFLTLQSPERERERALNGASVCSTACVCDNAHKTCMDKAFSFVRGTVYTNKLFKYAYSAKACYNVTLVILLWKMSVNKQLKTENM